MTLHNIDASNKDDAFYRHKMPRILTKIERCGNGLLLREQRASGRPPTHATATLLDEDPQVYCWNNIIIAEKNIGEDAMLADGVDVD